MFHVDEILSCLLDNYKATASWNVDSSPLKMATGGAPCVLFVGSTGSGKSTLCNFLYDLGESETKTFPEAKLGNHNPTTQNINKNTVEIRNSGTHNGSLFTFIDTPGLNESTEKDISHMRDLYEKILSVGSINVLVIVIPYNFKLDIQVNDTIAYFRDAFMPLFRAAGHVCVVVTQMSGEDFEKAEESGGVEKNIQQILQICNKQLGTELQHCCFFIIDARAKRKGMRNHSHFLS